ncbi:MAG: type II toxin-antitoxin system prevent-host-death family antitoxin [Bryobacteraceae bacterium]
MEVSAAYAKKNLAQILSAVERGETVTISRYGKSIARIVPTQTKHDTGPRFGTGKERVKILDPHWDKAIETQKELDAFLEAGL